jgi:hypothetical protein
MSWKHLDTQMQSFSDRLTIDVKLTPEMAARSAVGSIILIEPFI